MNLFLELGAVAITAGVAYAATGIICPADKRIIFWDNTVDDGQTILENTLRSDKRQIIIDIKLLRKNNYNIFSYFDELVVIFTTDFDEYWSMEYQSNVIYIQKSNDKETLMNKFMKSDRYRPLKHDISIQAEYLKKWDIDFHRCDNISKKQIYLNDLLKFVSEKDDSIKFSTSDEFIHKLLIFIRDKTGQLVSTVFDHFSGFYFTLWEMMKYFPSDYIEEVKWVYKIPWNISLVTFEMELYGFIGILIKTNKENYWLFEATLDDIFIQLSKSEDSLMQIFNEELSFTTPELCNGGYSMASLKPDRHPKSHYTTRDLEIGDLLKMVRNEKTYQTNSLDVVKSILTRIYKYPISLYNHSNSKFETIMDIIMSMPDWLVISNISFWSKLVDGRRQSLNSTSVLNSFVLMIRTSDRLFWSIERGDNLTYVQVSKDQTNLIKFQREHARIRPLKPLPRIEKKTVKEDIKMKGLLEFIMEFHRCFSGVQAQDCVKCCLGCLGLLA